MLMEEIIQGFGTTELVIMLVLGIGMLVMGYRIKKIAFFIAWFILGYIGTSYLMPQITEIAPEVVSTKLFQILIPIGGGLLVALLGFSIEKLCVAGICFVLTMLASIQYFGTDIQTIAISAIIGVVVAGAATMLMKPATIIATASVGAYAMTIALIALIPSINQSDAYWPMLLALAAGGSIVQFLTTKNVS